MKITYVANIRMPTEKAHGIQIMKMCEAFSAAGVQMELIVPRRLNEIHDDPFEYYSVSKSFKIRKLPVLDLVSFGRAGFIVESISFSIAALFVCRKADAIYSRDEIPLWLLSLFRREKVFWEAHMGQKNFIARSLLKRMAGLVAISSGLREFYVRLGVPSEKTIISHDGVDLKDFEKDFSKDESRRALGLPTDKKIAMYIGLLDEWKGYTTFLRAAKIISPTVATVIGGGRQEVERLRKIHPDVIFIGYRKYSELPANQKAADVLVIPNSGKYQISRYFTSPLKVFAHMASGVPVVASDLPSIREVLSDETATFFAPDDPESLAGAIGLALNNPAASEKAWKAALEVKKYTWRKRAENIIKFISSNV